MLRDEAGEDEQTAFSLARPNVDLDPNSPQNDESLLYVLCTILFSSEDGTTLIREPSFVYTMSSYSMPLL